MVLADDDDGGGALFDQISQSNVILLPRHTPRLSFIAVPALPTPKTDTLPFRAIIKDFIEFFQRAVSSRC